MKKLLSLILVLTLVLSMTACDDSASTGTDSNAGNENSQGTDNQGSDATGANDVQVKVAITTDETPMNQYRYVSDTGIEITKLIYDPLLNLDENQVAQPWLAKDYTISEDGLTYTFYLHEGVTFHDGEPLTAEDVKFTYEYLQEYPKSRFSSPAAVIETITVIDPLTVEMKLSAPQSDLFLTKPLAELGILPKHLWENETDPDNSDLHIGSGPYKLTEIKSGEYYMFEANTEYYNGKPAVGSIYMPIIKDQNAAFTALTAKQIDVVIRSIPAELRDQFESNDNFETLEVPAFSSNLMVMNYEVYPFNVLEFRQALATATDIQEIVDVVMLGMATPGSPGFVHPNMTTYNSDIAQYEFDLDEANSILDKLNFMDSDGDGIREDDQGNALSFEILVYANSPQRLRTAELFKEWYAQIGVELTIMALDMAVVDDLVWPDFDAANGRDFDMVMWGWGASTMPAPSRYAENLHSDFSIGSSNIGGFVNSQIDAVSDTILTEVDKEKLDVAIKEYQALVAEQVPFITTYYPNEIYAFNPDIYDGYKVTVGKGIMSNISFLDMSAE